ncbi:MAG TPA: DUF1549 and DUF1553 domain-containing protein, partial [Planctomycetota bacterium]|nr:DUF1549 and DUF1553 domain-containing protein [Planctomycetota bacterium]
RNVSPYRDWVIRSFNENMPFDRFTIAQLAGDLLPEPTLWDRVASGYNKLSQTTEEGGAQAKEYEAKTSADRVRNVSVVWMGATMGCAECHDHKFDPWTMKDFYSLAAFFADIEEPAIMDRDRGIPVPVTSAQESELRALDLRIESLRDRLASPPPEVAKTLGEARIAWETEVRAGSSGGGDAPPEEIRTILAKAEVDRSDAERRKLDEHWLAIAPPLAAVREELAAAEKEREKLVASLPRCLVAKSGAPRTVRILPRGNWMDDTGEVVEPAVPAYFGRLDVEGRPTRLDLARWLVSTENPLTARVLVNRLWKLFFGAGISRGLEDLGAMGEPPSHPDLLDWLAVELVESGWDVKHMVRLMVLSSTYRQSSAGRADLASRDPYNRLLARQSRWRLDAELVRDNALAVSGLLSREIGGPSVFPYQPPGYWVNLNFPKREWKNDSGDNQWRRGLYTWWQRSFLHPSLLAFDAPSREECVAERPRSNIPQQALVLLNDPTYVEAARVFATRILADGGDTDETRIRWGFRRATSRKPEANEVAILADLLERHRASWAADPEGASELLAVGQATKPDGAEAIEVAAWTSIARVLLNLHETITRN